MKPPLRGRISDASTVVGRTVALTHCVTTVGLHLQVIGSSQDTCTCISIDPRFHNLFSNMNGLHEIKKIDVWFIHVGEFNIKHK